MASATFLEKYFDCEYIRVISRLTWRACLCFVYGAGVNFLPHELQSSISELREIEMKYKIEGWLLQCISALFLSFGADLLATIEQLQNDSFDPSRSYAERRRSFAALWQKVLEVRQIGDQKLELTSTMLETVSCIYLIVCVYMYNGWTIFLFHPAVSHHKQQSCYRPCTVFYCSEGKSYTFCARKLFVCLTQRNHTERQSSAILSLFPWPISWNFRL